MNERQISHLLDELASDVQTTAPDTRRMVAHRQKTNMTVFLTVAVAAAVALVIAVPLVLNQGDGNSDLASPSGNPSESGSSSTEVTRGPFAFPVPEGMTLVESPTCEGNGVKGDVVVVTSGPIGRCVHSHAGELRIYVTGLANPPFGEAWETVTVPNRDIDGIEVRKLSPQSSLLTLNGTYIGGMVALQEDFVMIVTGGTPETTNAILDSVHLS